ncbi:MAG: hypothetical protein V5A20_13090 [Salinibacter sp.]|uniref:hypothetical protein n=1 Tax=Salinibacter sp. TaxID=2065818 RepID=UPI002FC2A7A2
MAEGLFLSRGSGSVGDVGGAPCWSVRADRAEDALLRVGASTGGPDGRHFSAGATDPDHQDRV